MTDMFTPESSRLDPSRFLAGVPFDARELVNGFRPPADMTPTDPLRPVYLAFHQMAHALADRLPNGPLLITAVEDLRTAMDSALAAMRDG
jgi:hypothetical protein